MPLWQSMQVFSFVNKKRWCATEARGDCRVMSIDSALWQLRHSSESLALNRAHSCNANSSRWSTNLSRVSMLPKMWPQTSLETCILRAILSVQLCGDVAIGTAGAHAGAVGEMDRRFQFREHVVVHLM